MKSQSEFVERFLEIDHDFASIADDVDVRDIDAVKKSYVVSLEKIKGVLRGTPQSL